MKQGFDWTAFPSILSPPTFEKCFLFFGFQPHVQLRKHKKRTKSAKLRFMLNRKGSKLDENGK